MATIKGVGVVWGISGGLYAQATGAPLTQSQDWKIESEQKEFKDSVGNTKGLSFFNENYELTMDVVPSGSTLTLAKAENILPTTGSKVTITDADDSEIAGDYLFISGNKKKAIDQEVILTFVLKRWIDNDVTATIT